MIDGKPTLRRETRLDTAVTYVYRNIGPFTVKTGWQANGAEALVEVVIRRDRMSPGNHAEDIQMELADMLVKALEPRVKPVKA